MQIQMMFFGRLLSASCLVAVLSTMEGCQRGPKKYQVRGTVHYKDGTVPKAGVAVVNFVPTKESKAELKRPGSGSIQPDGSFTMFTKVAGDGVYEGEYTVTFTIIKSPMNPESLVQPQYMRAASSPYKITVDGDKLEERYEIEPLPGVKGAAAAPSQGS